MPKITGDTVQDAQLTLLQDACSADGSGDKDVVAVTMLQLVSAAAAEVPEDAFPTAGGSYTPNPGKAPDKATSEMTI